MRRQMGGDSPPQNGAVFPQEMMVIGGGMINFHNLHECCPVRVLRSTRVRVLARNRLLPDQISKDRDKMDNSKSDDFTEKYDSHLKVEF